MPVKQDRQFTPSFKAEVRVVHAGSAALLLPVRLHAFLLTERHQNTLAPMLFHKLVGGAAWPKPKKPSNQGKGAAHRNLENLKGVTVREATFQVRCRPLAFHTPPRPYLRWHACTLC